MILGSFSANMAFGSIASIAVVLGAIYLLWSYQRMAHGPVHEEHRSLPDVSIREVAVVVREVEEGCAACVFLAHE